MFSASATFSSTSLLSILLTACGFICSFKESTVAPVNCMYCSMDRPWDWILIAKSSTMFSTCVSIIASGISIVAFSTALSTTAFSFSVLACSSFFLVRLSLISFLYSSRVSNSETSFAKSSSSAGSSFASILWMVHLNTAAFPASSSA